MRSHPLLALLLASPALAGDYLPLETGDSVVYEDDTWNTTVLTTVTRSYGQHWYLNDSFLGRGPIWVRSRPNSTSYSLYTPATGEQVFFDSAAALGTRWRVTLDACNSGPVTLAARGLTVTTPAGTFDDVLRLDLTPSCADAGITSVWLAPGVGPVQWQELNIAGTVTYVAHSGQVGELLLPKAFGLDVAGSFAATEVWYDMMPAVPPGGPAPILLRASIRVKNLTPYPEVFDFRTSQRFDIHVLDANGAVVSSWSRGMAFLQVLGQITLAPGEGMGWDGEVSLTDARGAPLQPGQYTVRVEVANADRARPAVEAPLFIGWAY